MATFADRVSLALLDDPSVTDLLVNQIGLAPLFGVCWQLEAGTVNSLALTRIRSREWQKPVFQTVRTRGSEEVQSANPHRVRIDYLQPRHGLLEWLELFLEVDLEVVVDDHATPLKSVKAVDFLADLGNPATLPALRAALEARYGPYLRDRLLAELKIHSIEELRHRGALTLTLESEPAPPFDPDDPANHREVPLRLAFRAAAQLEPTAALAKAKLARSLLEDEQLVAPELAGFEAKRPYAFVTLFPDSVAVDNAIPGLTAAQIRTRVKALFAAEEMTAHFVAGM
ncbi:MAG: hypothetical protein U0002_04715 [Thermoanaerobaculia bacterium]